MKVEIYIKFLNETLIQYRNNMNSIKNARLIPRQYKTQKFKKRFLNWKLHSSVLSYYSSTIEMLYCKWKSMHLIAMLQTCLIKETTIINDILLYL